VQIHQKGELLAQIDNYDRMSFTHWSVNRLSSRYRDCVTDVTLYFQEEPCIRVWYACLGQYIELMRQYIINGKSILIFNIGETGWSD
jgi:predicted metalloenzyme YecM